MLRGLVIIVALSFLSCTSAGTWAKRGVGALGAFALHEACHIVMVTALGGGVESVEWRGVGPYFNYAPGMENKRRRVVAFSGNVCTGILAEILLATKATQKSELA